MVWMVSSLLAEGLSVQPLTCCWHYIDVTAFSSTSQSIQIIM